MLCEKCGKNHATTHIRTVINGVAHEWNLCSQCAHAEGYGTDAHDPLDNLFAPLFGETVARTEERTCPQCGCTFSDISATGKVGCATCYRTFHDRLLPYIQRVHGSKHHVGTTPNQAEEKTAQKPTAESLRARLQELIREEKYEEAARVRDEIRSLEGGAGA